MNHPRCIELQVHDFAVVLHRHGSTRQAEFRAIGRQTSRHIESVGLITHIFLKIHHGDGSCPTRHQKCAIDLPRPQVTGGELASDRIVWLGEITHQVAQRITNAFIGRQTGNWIPIDFAQIESAWNAGGVVECYVSHGQTPYK